MKISCSRICVFVIGVSASTLCACAMETPDDDMASFTQESTVRETQHLGCGSPSYAVYLNESIYNLVPPPGMASRPLYSVKIRGRRSFDYWALLMRYPNRTENFFVRTEGLSYSLLGNPSISLQSSTDGTPQALTLQIDGESPVVLTNCIKNKKPFAVNSWGTEPEEPKLVTNSGSIAAGEEKFFGPYWIKSGTEFVAKLSGDGDADLFVNTRAKPEVRFSECKSTLVGSLESCTIKSSGDVYVMVRGKAPNSAFTLEISYMPK